MQFAESMNASGCGRRTRKSDAEDGCEGRVDCIYENFIYNERRVEFFRRFEKKERQLTRVLRLVCVKTETRIDRWIDNHVV